MRRQLTHKQVRFYSTHQKQTATQKCRMSQWPCGTASGMGVGDGGLKNQNDKRWLYFTNPKVPAPLPEPAAYTRETTHTPRTTAATNLRPHVQDQKSSDQISHHSTGKETHRFRPRVGCNKSRQQQRQQQRYQGRTPVCKSNKTLTIVTAAPT